MLSAGSFWGRTSVRLFVLVLLVLCPLIVHDLYQMAERRRLQLDTLQQSLHRLAAAITREQGALIEGGRGLLAALAEIDPVRGSDRAACAAAIARVARPFDRYGGFSRLDLDGTLVCTLPEPAGAPLVLPDASALRDAVATRSFVPGRFGIGPRTGQAGVVLSHPLLDRHGEVTGIVSTTLTLDWLAGYLRDLGLPSGAGVTVLDGDGTVLARHPDGAEVTGAALRPGESIAGSALAVALHRGGGVARIDDPVWGASLIGYAEVQGVPGGLTVVVDMPDSAALAEQSRETVQRLGILALAIALSLAAAWFGSRALILKWVDSLSRLARRLAGGELAARSEIVYGASEMGQLTRVFDEMAAELQARDAALEAGRAKYRTLVQNMQDGLFVIRDGRLLFVNQAFAQMIGSAPDELPGRRVEDLVAPEDRPLVAARLREEPAGGAAAGTVEITLLHQDGRTRIDALISIGAFTAEDGRPACLGTVKDITARKRTEQALVRERALLRHLIDAIPDSIFIKDAKGVYLACNRAFAARLGTTPERVVGRIDEELSGPAEAAFHCCKDQEVLASGAPVRVEEEVVLPDGTMAHVETIEVPHFGPRHERLGVIGIGRDITARKLMELELNRLATTDPLTGTCNRRHFFQLSERELGRARRYGRPLTVLMIDIDYFKQINDTCGHAAGDAVLTTLALKCREVLREHDILGRLGGEEFGVTLPETDLATGAAVAERLRAALAAMEVWAETQRLHITASIGVAECTNRDESFESVLNRADHALYRAKAAGRNQVATAETIRAVRKTA